MQIIFFRKAYFCKLLQSLGVEKFQLRKCIWYFNYMLHSQLFFMYYLSSMWASLTCLLLVWWKEQGINDVSTYIYLCCSASLKVGDMSHAMMTKFISMYNILRLSFLWHTFGHFSHRLNRTSCPSVPWPQPAAEPERRGGSEGTRPLFCCLQRSVSARATAGRARRLPEDGSGWRRRPATLGRAPAAHNSTNTAKSCGRSPLPEHTGSPKTAPSLHKRGQHQRLLLQISKIIYK